MTATPAPTGRPVAPGPRPLPLVGNAAEFRRGFLEAARRGFREHGDVFRLRVGARRLVFVSHPDLAQQVLVDRAADYPKNETALGLGSLLGRGLVTNNDHASWLTQRRMMQPMFHRARLAAMGDKMTAAAARLLGELDARPDGAELDVHDAMMRVTLDIITQTMFSADVMGEAGRVGPAVGDGTRLIQRRIQQPIIPPLRWPTPSNLAFRRVRGVLDDIVYRLIDERRADRAAGKDAPGDLLDMLLDARDADTGEGMTREQLRDEVLTVFSAGHETTANTLTFAWWALARRPDLLARLHAELDAVLGGRPPTVDDLANLPFTRAVLDETLRLYPAAPVVSPRLVTKPGTLGGYAVDPGDVVFVHLFNIHRHPAFWPDPDAFDPDRFLEGRTPSHRFAYVPFGAGARKCIGNHLALMEGQLLLAAIAGRYDLRARPGHEVELEQTITLRAKGGLPMTLHRR